MRKSMERIAALCAAVVLVVLASIVPASAATDEATGVWDTRGGWFDSDNIPYGGEYGNDGSGNANDIVVGIEYQALDPMATPSAMNSTATGFHSFAASVADDCPYPSDLRVYSWCHDIDGDGNPVYYWNDISYANLNENVETTGAMLGDFRTTSGENMANSEMPENHAYFFNQLFVGNARYSLRGLTTYIDTGYDDRADDVLCVRWRSAESGQRYAFYIVLVTINESVKQNDYCTVYSWSDRTLFVTNHGKNAFGDYGAGYNAGYREGYAVGKMDGGMIDDGALVEAERKGYDKGYNDGMIRGEEVGYANGVKDGSASGTQLDYSTPAASVGSFFVSIFVGIKNLVTPILDVELFGFSVSAMVSTLAILLVFGFLLTIILKVVK